MNVKPLTDSHLTDDDAYAEFVAACAASNTDAADFEAQCLSGIESWMPLDDDPDTDAHLQAVITRIRNGDKDAADSAYWSWLHTQLQLTDEGNTLQPLD